MTPLQRQTEGHLAASTGLDARDDATILAAIVAGQERAVAAVRAAIPAIADASRLLVTGLKSGGRLIYAGAGTSIRIAVQDGSELPATFGFDESRILYLIAGGRAALFETAGDVEDDVAAATRDAAVCRAGDTVIAVAASGSTPYTLAAARVARGRGAKVIAVVNNPASPLEATSHVAIVLDSGPEVIVGSTRMGAGTAQKACLNMLSTLCNIRLGAVHDGYMVAVRADNAKLRARARGIVMAISGADEGSATAALEKSAGEVKPAVLLCAGAPSLAVAHQLLADCDGNLRATLARL